MTFCEVLPHPKEFFPKSLEIGVQPFLFPLDAGDRSYLNKKKNMGVKVIQLAKMEVSSRASTIMTRERMKQGLGIPGYNNLPQFSTGVISIHLRV